MKCRHSNAILYGWAWNLDGTGYWYEVPYLARHQADARVCLDCRTWLPLGHSDETDPRVALEIRAAQLADEFAEADRLCDFTFGTFGDDEERRGFSLAETNMQHHTVAYQAGALARAICEHEES